MGGALGNSYKSCSLTLEAKRKMAKNILAWCFLQEEKSGRGVHFAMYPAFIQKSLKLTAILCGLILLDH